jgi:hypothetical protein
MPISSDQDTQRGDREMASGLSDRELISQSLGDGRSFAPCSIATTTASGVTWAIVLVGSRPMT